MHKTKSYLLSLFKTDLNMIDTYKVSGLFTVFLMFISPYAARSFLADTPIFFGILLILIFY